MKKIIIIGTVHLKWTPKEELVKEIKKHNPDKVFIELTEKEVADGKDKSIRDEMFGVLEWVEAEEVPYTLFDIDESTLKPGVTGKEDGFMEYELKVKKLLEGQDWKTLNNTAPWEGKEVDALEKMIVEKYFNKEKMEERNREIERNIEKNLIEGTNVIITGAGHIGDLLKAFPNSIAPLRKD